MHRCKTLRKIALLTFPTYKGSKISIDVADSIDRHLEKGAAYIDWLIDLAHIEEAGPNNSRGDEGRDLLPISSGLPILPGQSAQITARAQTSEFCCDRFVISNAGTPGGAADWIVNAIKIGNRSQLAQSGDVPGGLFATNAIDTYVSFEPVKPAMDVVVVVTYVGPIEAGAPFFAAVVGTVGPSLPQYVRVLQPNAIHRKGLVRTKIPLGFAFVSQRINVNDSESTSITIYIPPIDQASINVAVDATLEAGEPTQAVNTLIAQALDDDRGGLVHDAYVALVVQHAHTLTATAAQAPQPP